MRDRWEELPADYFARVKAQREALNDQADHWLDDGVPPTSAEIDQYEAEGKALDELRLVAAVIRDDGYSQARSDMHDGLPVENGVQHTPYPKGSGAAKVWVRGYIQGRSTDTVIDPRPYLEDA